MQAQELLIETFNELTAEQERAFKVKAREAIQRITALQTGIVKMKEQLAAEQKALRELAHEPLVMENIWKTPQ